MLYYAGRAQGGDTAILPGLLISFGIFGIAAPYAVYRVNRYRYSSRPTSDEVLKREQELQKMEELKNDQKKA